MFSVNVLNYFQMLFMWFLRSPSVVSFIYSFLTPLQRINNELEIYRSDKRYQLSINAQIINLQRLLNKTFNPDAVYDNIYITEEEVFYEMIYIGNIGTQDAEIYFSNSWIDDYYYIIVGDVVCYSGVNYIANHNSTGELPSDLNTWDIMQDEVPHIGNNSIYVFNYNFIINIDQTLYTDLGVNKINQLKALINKNKIFGTKHTINIY